VSLEEASSDQVVGCAEEDVDISVRDDVTVQKFFLVDNFTSFMIVDTPLIESICEFAVLVFGCRGR
jgi:hypothetical protein